MTIGALRQKSSSTGSAGASWRVRDLPSARLVLRVSGAYCLGSAFAFVVQSACAGDAAGLIAPGQCRCKMVAAEAARVRAARFADLCSDWSPTRLNTRAASLGSMPRSSRLLGQGGRGGHGSGATGAVRAVSRSAFCAEIAEILRSGGCRGRHWLSVYSTDEARMAGSRVAHARP